MSSEEQALETGKYVGLGLSLASGVLIGVSFIITKKGLIDTAKRGGKVLQNKYSLMHTLSF
jgi:hypothetical protein